MRYTRNRQLNKAYKTNEHAGDKNYPFGKWLEGHPDIDHTFKWHREFVWEIDKYWESYITIGTYGKSDFKRIWIK